jgi:REP element-mobilizing transposase RayT
MVQAVTFRLADSLPQKVIDGWRAELDQRNPKSEAELRRRIAHWEDAGHGDCLLAKPAHAELVENALLHFDQHRYRLLEWCIMPNHVHVILEQLAGIELDQIVKSWKSYTARKINDAEGRSGALWEREYHDRYIRDGKHLEDARLYVRNNPVVAGLCSAPVDWSYSSASAALFGAEI